MASVPFPKLRAYKPSVGFKLTLFLIFSAVCFLLGWWNAIWSDATVVNWIRFGGYWIILTGTLLWIWSLLRAYPQIKRKETYRRFFQKKNYLPIAVVLLAWGWVQLAENKNFKILLDEPVLVNTSRMMHYERQTYVVSNAERVDGILASKGYVDKRPNFFPFLISVLHDLTGYRVENAFVLNSLLTLALFALIFSVVSQIAGRAGGYLSLGLLFSVPLVWHQSSGAGFEILNLVMLLLTLKVAIDYLNKPSDKALLSALCLTTVMLSQVRYESVLFIIPVAIIILMGWSLSKKPSLPWGAWLSPFLLVPVLWQQRVFNLDQDFWELFTVEGARTPFSLDYFGGNIAQAVYFFFEWMRQIPNAPLVAYIGWTATFAFLVLMCLRMVVREHREPTIDSDRPTLVLWVFLLGFALYFTLLMSYAFDLGRYMVQRLSLPLYLAIAVISGVVWCKWLRGRIWYAVLGIVVAIGFLGYSLPSAMTRDYAATYFPMVEGQHVERFIREHKNERYLIVADMSMLWTTYDIEAIPNRAVNHQPAIIKYFLENPNNPPIYVMQSLEYDPVTRHFVDVASEPLINNAVLQPIKDYSVGSFRILRMSRLVDINGVEPIDDSELYKGGEAKKIQDWVDNLL